MVVCSVGHYLVAALNRGRFHWSDRVSLAVRTAALVGFAAATLAQLWAMAANPYFSSAVRVQRDRGQRVISDGPYRIVRHPGYAVGLVHFALSGLALGSVLSAVVGAATSVLLVRRTAIEDRLLHAELPGYAE